MDGVGRSTYSYAGKQAVSESGSSRASNLQATPRRKKNEKKEDLLSVLLGGDQFYSVVDFLDLDAIKRLSCTCQMINGRIKSKSQDLENKKLVSLKKILDVIKNNKPNNKALEESELGNILCKIKSKKEAIVETLLKYKFDELGRSAQLFGSELFNKLPYLLSKKYTLSNFDELIGDIDENRDIKVKIDELKVYMSDRKIVIEGLSCLEYKRKLPELKIEKNTIFLGIAEVGIEKKSPKEEYAGTFKNGKKDGYGEYRLESKYSIVTYKGSWREGKEHGLGSSFENIKDGMDLTYSGEWYFGKKEGFGVLSNKSDGIVRMYKGFWKKGKVSGKKGRYLEKASL